MRCVVIAAATALAIAGSAAAKEPDCAGPERWPAAMTFTHLKNAKVLDPDALDLSKTSSRLISSQPIGKGLHRQVHLVRYVKKSGEVISAIAVNEVSSQECSVSGVDVYLVASKFGDYTDDRGEPMRWPSTAAPSMASSAQNAR